MLTAGGRKFFGNPNGAKTAPQQSRLAFSKKVEEKKVKEAQENDSDEEVRAPKANGRIKEEVKAEDEEGDVVMKDKPVAEESDSDVLVNPRRESHSSPQHLALLLCALQVEGTTS